MLNQGNIHSIVKQTSISLPQRQEENRNNEAACDPSLVARFYCCVSKGIRTCVNKTDTFERKVESYAKNILMVYFVIA